MRKKLSIIFACFCMMLVSSVVVGCGNVKVTLSTEKTTLKPGESTQIIIDKKSDDIKLEISDGEEYATLSADGVLTIKEDAKVGEVVTTVAKKDGEVVSNELDVTIASILAEGITATCTPNATTVDRGTVVMLSYTTTPAKITESVTWTITEGSQYATLLMGNLLQINTTAPYDAQIKVQAKSESQVASNVLTFTVASVPLTELTISSIPNKTDVTKGMQLVLNYNATPSNTTEVITYVITDGEEYATLNGNILVVNNNAPIGSEISVKAKGKTIYSNELTFTVIASPEEERYIGVTSDMTIDDASSTANILSVIVENGNHQIVSDTVNYTIMSGEEFLSIEHNNGDTCELNVLGHGTATLKVSVPGAVDQTVTIKCIKAPENILLPEALVEKTNIEFATGVNQEIAGFEFQVLGTKVCQDLAYSIQKWNGSEYVTSTAGTLVENKLKFTETGKFKLTAVSASGSSRQVLKEVTFNVNEGVNVDTYEDFKTNVQQGKIVNIMNLTKENGDYDYNLVPSYILNNTETEKSHNSAIITVRGKAVKINGNGYKLDLSGMKYFQYWMEGEKTRHSDYGSLIQILATEEQSDREITNSNSYNIDDAQTEDQIIAKKRNLTQADYFVDINNLDIVGNSHVDGRIADQAFSMAGSLAFSGDQADVSQKTPQGRLRSTFNRAITIGEDSIFVAYQVSINNVEISGFNRGMRISHAVSGSNISNTYVGDCFVNGIELAACEMTLTNMTYGLCGAAGIEITPERAQYAGLNFSKNQSVTFAGDIKVDSSALNNGATPYLQLFEQANGMSITSAVVGSMIAALGKTPVEGYIPTEEEQAKMANVITSLSEPSMCIIGLIFENTNPSTLSYSNELNDGIINFSNITAKVENTYDPHKYVELTLLQGLGKVLLFNLGYLQQN